MSAVGEIATFVILAAVLSVQICQLVINRSQSRINASYLEWLQSLSGMTDWMKPRTCARCGRTTFSADDMTEGYCGHCHEWTQAQKEADELP